MRSGWFVSIGKWTNKNTVKKGNSRSVAKYTIQPYLIQTIVTLKQVPDLTPRVMCHLDGVDGKSSYRAITIP